MPNTPVLNITDHASGAGAVASIAGSSGGSANAVSVQAVDGDLGGTSWTLTGSRTGDGTVELSLSAGYYWGRCVSSLAGSDALSNLIYFAVTTGSDAVHQQCLVAVQARIQSLLLEGIAGTSIVVRKLPWARHDLPLPGIILSTPRHETMPATAGSNLRDNVGYPVLVSMVAADNQDLATHQGRFLLWRERIARAFRQQRLPGVPEVWNCTVEPADIVGPAEYLKNLYCSSLTLRFLSREPRGV